MAQRGRIGLALVGVLALAGAATAGAWWLWFRDRPIEGFLVGLHAVDADRAVVCMRANYDDEPSRAWVALVHRAQGLVWYAELPDMPVNGPRDGLTVAGGVVTVRTASDVANRDGLAVSAFSLQSGAPLWRRDLSAGLEAPTDGSGPLASDQLHVETLETRDGVAAFGFARQTGELLWRRAEKEQGRILEGAHLAGPHLISEPVAEARFYPLANDAPPVQLDSRGPGCGLGDRYYALGTPDEEPQAVVLLSVAPSEEGLLDPRFQRLDLPGVEGASEHVKVEACGVYRGKLVFTYTRARAGTADGLEIIAVEPDSGALAWHFDVGVVNLRPSLNQAVIYSDYRESFPLSGTLTRFVPVLLDEEREGDHTRLVILDLEEQRIIREGPKRHELSHASVFRVGQTHYVVGRLTGPFLVAALDGATGELHAQHIYGPYEEVLPFHVRDGTLWVYTTKWKRLDLAPWAALDAATLAPLHNNGVEIGDADNAVLEILDAAGERQRGQR